MNVCLNSDVLNDMCKNLWLFFVVIIFYSICLTIFIIDICIVFKIVVFAFFSKIIYVIIVIHYRQMNKKFNKLLSVRKNYKKRARLH